MANLSRFPGLLNDSVESKAEARCERGVLSMKLPKAAGKASRRLTVS